MKKITLGIVILLVLGGAAFLFWARKPLLWRPTPAAKLVPSETLLLVEIPDLGRTLDAAGKTELAKLFSEPEMQAFLERPRQAVPGMQDFNEQLAEIKKLQPRSGFVAVTSLEGAHPTVAAGFSFSGSKEHLEKVLAGPRANLKRSYPAGKSDISTDRGAEIQTFKTPDLTVIEAVRGGWYFASDDLALLQSMLDAQSGKPVKSLSDETTFQKAHAHLPSENEIELYAHLSPLIERFTGLLKASGQVVDAQQLAEYKKIQAVAWGTKFEGPLLRDTFFLARTENSPQAPLPQKLLATTSDQTVIFYDTALLPEWHVPKNSEMAFAAVPGFAPIIAGLQAKKLSWDDLPKAFGPELGFTADWPAKEDSVSGALAVQIRDRALAQTFLGLLTEPLAGSTVPAWNKSEKEGTTFYQAPTALGALPVHLWVAINDQVLLLGFSEATLQTMVQRFKAGNSALAQTAQFKESIATVKAPDFALGYLDFATLFKRSYGTARPLLAMSLAFNPAVTKYIDAGKLPSTETFTRHLGGIVSSSTRTEDGILYQSTGVLTQQQATFFAVAGATAAAFPMLQKMIENGQSPFGFNSGAGLTPGSGAAPKTLIPVVPPAVPPQPATPFDAVPDANPPPSPSNGAPAVPPAP